MPIVGSYSKACPVSKLRQFSGWQEKSENVRAGRKTVDGQAIEESRELSDNDYLYLQENFTVTDGIFMDQNIIFDEVTPEWKEFCETVLKFKAPDSKGANAGSN